MEVQIVGYLALIFLILAFISLARKNQIWFLWLDIAATFLFVVYSILLRDIPFIVGQIFVFIMLIYTVLDK